MSNLFKAARTTLVLFGMLMAAAVSVAADDKAAPGDVARFVAGMEPSANSPLTAMTKERSWQLHSRHFDQAWKALEQRQLNPIANFQKTNLSEHNDFMLYLFSGPDFLYANAFFPNASTYIFTGLEPVGKVPSLTNLSASTRAYSLQALRASMQTIVNISFFITKKMHAQLREGSLTGTLPVLYVFMARAGKTVEKVELVTLKTDGTIAPASANTERADAPGAKITFSDPDGTTKTLYYFRTDLSNGGMKYNGLSKFIESQGTADALIKSASYLMHGGNFKTTRDLILKQSSRILQDDSGIPLRFYDKETWNFKPFGYYRGPIPIFSGQYQRDMQRLFTSAERTPIKFGFGYKWRPNQSNVLLSTRKVMPKAEMKSEDDATDEAMAKPADDKTEEAMDKPAEEATEETMAKPDEEAVEEAGEEPMEKPAEDTSDQSTNDTMENSDKKAETDEMAQKPEVDVAAISTCRADCGSVYEPCRDTADQRMESCFASSESGQCQLTWKDEAGQCINERMACMAKCS